MAITENQLLLGGAIGGGCFLISTVLTLMVLVHRERVRMNKTESSGRGRVVIRADSTGSTNIQSVIRPTDGTLDHQEESFPQRNSTHRFSTRSNTRSAYTSRSFRSRSLDGYTADGAYNEPLMYPLHVGHDVPFPDHTRHQQTVRSNLSHPHVEGSPAVVPFRESNLPGQGHVHYSSEGRLTSSTSRGKDEDVKYMDSQSEVDSVYSSRRSIPVNIGTSYHRNMDDPPSYRDNPPSYTSEELSTSLAHNPHPAHNPHQSNVRSRYGRILHSTSSSQGQGSSSHSGKYQKNQTSRSDRRPSNDVTNMDDRRSTNASRRGDRRPSDVKSTSMHDIRQPSEHASSRRQNSYEGSSAVPGIALPSYYETADHYSDVSSDVEHIDVWHSEDDGYF